MNVLINLTPTEETQLSAVATRTGLDLEAFITQLVREHLPASDPAQEMRRRLRAWQKDDNTPRIPPIPTRSGLPPTAALFAQWEEEDATMTDAEREADEQLWEDFQKGIDDERRNAGMRTLF